MTLSDQDRAALIYARGLLEHPSLAAKMASLVGTPVEKLFDLLPDKWSDTVTRSTRSALQKALGIALASMEDRRGLPSSNVLHKVVVAATGAGGGAFGFAALPIELPVSTTVMLRSIADIARSEGERLTSLDTQLACIEVFALGGQPHGDDATETGYFAVRAALSRTVAEAARYITERGLAEEGAPAIVRLIAQIAARFGVVVSEKAAAQAAPVLGAAGGALVNLIFIDHFQDMARGHFIVRRLERTYGAATVRAEYERLAEHSGA
jgi:hypothetical protein